MRTFKPYLRCHLFHEIFLLLSQHPSNVPTFVPPTNLFLPLLENVSPCSVLQMRLLPFLYCEVFESRVCALFILILLSSAQRWASYGVCACCMNSCSVVSDSFVTPWTVARQAPLSMGFPRQEH